MPRKSNTRAASGAGSIRQRPDGRWEARVTVGSNPGTGKPIRRSIYGDTQAAVRKEMTAVLRDVDRGTYQTPSKMTVKIWMETWLDTFCTGLKPLTVSAYNTAMKTHIVPAFGAMPVQELKGIHVQKLFNDMLEAGKSPKTVKNTAAILHKALSVAVKQGYIAANPCEAAEVPKVTRHEIKPLTDAEIPVFLAAIEDHPFRNAYGLCLFAGLREGECLGLTWDCVDFDRGRITVRQQLQKSRTESGTYRIVSSTKSGKVRVIEPPVVAFDYLRSERTRQVENRLRAGKLWDNAQDLVFTNPLGGHVVIETFRRNFKRLAASMGRPDLRPHDLRHPYVKYTTKIFSLRLMDFQAQAYPDARRKTRGACQLHRGGQSQSPVRPLCNRKRFSCLPPQSKMSWILYAISIRLSGYTSTRSISSSASSVVSVSASKIALDASLRLSCRACSSFFCFACANTAA